MTRISIPATFVTRHANGTASAGPIRWECTAPPKSVPQALLTRGPYPPKSYGPRIFISFFVAARSGMASLYSYAPQKITHRHPRAAGLLGRPPRGEKEA